MSTICLHCPRCGDEVDVRRDENDPPNAVRAYYLCETCCNATGTKEPAMVYYDSKGNELTLAAPGGSDD